MLNGYFRLRGSVDVMGLISASLELRLELEYRSQGNKMLGRATVKFRVKLAFFRKTFKATVERQFAGSKPSQNNLRLRADVPRGGRTGAITLAEVYGPIVDVNLNHPWLDYWQKFAA